MLMSLVLFIYHMPRVRLDYWCCSVEDDKDRDIVVWGRKLALGHTGAPGNMPDCYFPTRRANSFPPGVYV